MCGIFCMLSCESNDSELLEKFSVFKNNIERRGPDNFNLELLRIDNYNLLFASSVLWLQGIEITKQPISTQDGILIYNGDIFRGFISDDTRESVGDTKLFLNCLKNEINPQTLTQLEGPYAFVYLNKAKKMLYFARDPYGRRSLLLAKKNNQIIISSVAKRCSGFDFMEVPPIGIFSIDLITNKWKIDPWTTQNGNFNNKIKELETFINQDLNCIENTNDLQNEFTPPEAKKMDIFEQIQEGNIFEVLLKDSFWLENVITLEKTLREAVKLRISTQPDFCRNCFGKDCTHALTGILFSGGLDCTILALLVDDFTDIKRPIDLINVAFDRVPNYETPDRITSIATLEELKKIRPNREWNLVQVNVISQELELIRSETIADLIYPLKTILDDSLGCALWFASRASTSSYTSPCRILLVGMGADELFGGYTRHRAALQKSGWESLHRSLEQDWENLPYRNLARDDRVISDHGRQLRTPYLDEKVVTFVRGLNSWEKTCPLRNIPQGIGEKILLRTLAFHLGLTQASTFKKRALQFGSRIANSKENAHEPSPRLLT